MDMTSNVSTGDTSNNSLAAASTEDVSKDTLAAAGATPPACKARPSPACKVPLLQGDAPPNL